MKLSRDQIESTFQDIEDAVMDSRYSSYELKREIDDKLKDNYLTPEEICVYSGISLVLNAIISS